METLQTIRPELLQLTAGQFETLVPYFWMVAGLMVAVIAAVVRTISARWSVFLLAFLTCIGGAYFSFELLPNEPMLLFNSMMVSDTYANFFNIVFLVAAGLTVLSSFKYLDREGLQYPEYYLLLLFSVLGMMLMVSALDLIVIFIALEIMSLSVYMLVGFRRADRKANEASMKYFVLGGAASAVFLYGVALLYGATGSTQIQELLAHVTENGQDLSFIFVLGSWLVLAGFLFKVAAAPFHMWMPDVYEGAPAPITGFMTTGLKAAAFATFLRVFISMGYGKGVSTIVEENVHNILWVCAVATMVVGNLVALTQTNLKRLLGYSSIAHTGYLLVGFLAGGESDQGYAPIIVYLVSYVAMNLGAFVILTVLARKGDSGLTLADLSGLAKKSPWLAFAMAVFMLSRHC